MLSIRLKQLREIANLTQKELANKLETSQQNIAFWESGKRNPKYEMLKKLSMFFNVNPDYLLGKTDIKNPIEHQLENAELLFRTTVKDLDLTPAQQEQFKIDIANFIEERKKLFEEDK